MKAIEFPEHNLVLAKNQPQYTPLPCHRTELGEIISCWKPTWRERVAILFGAKLWHWQLTFGHPFQPTVLTLEHPFTTEDKA